MSGGIVQHILDIRFIPTDTWRRYTHILAPDSCLKSINLRDWLTRSRDSRCISDDRSKIMDNSGGETSW